MQPDAVLDNAILVLLVLGILGNAFMLWLISGWARSAHPNCNLCPRISRPNSDLVILDFKAKRTFSSHMCMYMAGLAIGDLGLMVMEWMVLNSAKQSLMKTMANSFKGTNMLRNLRDQVSRK